MRILQRVLGADRPERRAVVISGLFFFFLLFGYYLLRPLREAMGVERGMNDLRWLFLCTCIASLVVTLAFGGLVSRLVRGRFIPIAYRAVMACIIVFMIARAGFGDDARIYTGYVFYVWLSVVNLFMVSVFWSFMADTWSLDQGKRLYPAIGVGGTLGALVGSLVAWNMASMIGPIWQMGLAVVCFECALRSMKQLDRATDMQRGGKEPIRDTSSIGGNWIDGAIAVLRSPYLLGIGFYIALISVSSTLIYFTQAHIVVNAAEELESRIALFAKLDVWAQLATLLVQLFITRELIRRLGIGMTLAILPIVIVLGFTALSWTAGREGIEPWQVFAVFAAFNAIQRATRYAIIRPARETLFNVVPKEEKYKAKPIVDVFLYRGGDAAGVGVEQGLVVLGIGLGGLAMATAPLAVLWISLAYALAIAQNRRAERQRTVKR